MAIEILEIASVGSINSPFGEIENRSCIVTARTLDWQNKNGR